jgi:hypothetical protein
MTTSKRLQTLLRLPTPKNLAALDQVKEKISVTPMTAPKAAKAASVYRELAALGAPPGFAFLRPPNPYSHVAILAVLGAAPNPTAAKSIASSKAAKYFQVIALGDIWQP